MGRDRGSLSVERIEIVSRRLVIAGVAVAALGGAAVPAALASTGGPVTVDTSNGVRVAVHEGNTPIAGASVTPDGQACVGISLQLPICTPGGIIGPIGSARSAQTGPVTIRRDQYGTTIGVTSGGAPVAGVTIYNDGRVCGGIGEQVPVCTPGIDARAAHATRQSSPLPPVTVRHDDNGTVVGVGDVGVVISPSGRICPVVSTQAWQCIGGDTVGAQRTTTQSVPVTVRHDDNGTAVGVGEVGVVVYPDGTICPVISTDNVRCIHTPAS
jgi:hypothetical protein